MGNVRRLGDPATGRKVFQSSVTGCIACHQVQGISQLGALAKGPDLSAVGAGLQTELIIESIIWPLRQLKDGYEAATLMLDDRRSITGYIAARNDSTTSIRDMATNKVVVVAKASVEETVKGGTVMPEGATTLLTRSEFARLIAFLASCKGQVGGDK